MSKNTGGGQGEIDSVRKKNRFSSVKSSLNHSITTVFVEQPLASPGSANNAQMGINQIPAVRTPSG